MLLKPNVLTNCPPLVAVRQQHQMKPLTLATMAYNYLKSQQLSTIHQPRGRTKKQIKTVPTFTSFRILCRLLLMSSTTVAAFTAADKFLTFFFFYFLFFLLIKNAILVTLTVSLLSAIFAEEIQNQCLKPPYEI